MDVKIVTPINEGNKIPALVAKIPTRMAATLCFLGKRIGTEKEKKGGNKKLMLCDGRGRLGRHPTVSNFLDGEEYF